MTKLDLLKQARAARDLASRALKRAVRAGDEAHKERLRQRAERLRQQARDFEDRAAALQEAPFF
jgi:hypothetical protein